MTISQEPKIHSGADDELPEEHPLAYETVYCAECRKMLHAGYNECMTTWIEFTDANVCAECVGPLVHLWEDGTWATFKAERQRPT